MSLAPQDAVDTEVLAQATAQSGAVVMGRRVSAIGQARSAAADGDVVIMGGGDVIGQALEQGLVEELRLHLAPMLLGGGTPLFRSGTRQMYRQRQVRASRNAAHLTYERV